MSDGRTTWWGKDSEWWGRERHIALGEEFGSEGPTVIDWLSCQAQKQRDGGRVKTGYRAVVRGCFVSSVERAKAIIAHAVRIGVLDDFEDGEPFTARISGWSSDQSAIRAAARQADKRARDSAPDPADGHSKVTPSHAPSRSVTASHEESLNQTKPDQTRPEVDDSLRSSSSRRGTSSDQPGESSREALPNEAPLCHLLADLIAENGSPRPRIGKKWMNAERLLLERDGRERSEAERLICWCQASEFWKPNILSMAKFREKYDMLRLQAQRNQHVVARRVRGDEYDANMEVISA